MDHPSEMSLSDESKPFQNSTCQPGQEQQHQSEGQIFLSPSDLLNKDKLLGKRKLSSATTGVSGQADLNVVFCDAPNTKRSTKEGSQTTDSAESCSLNKRSAKAAEKQAKSMSEL